MEANWWREFFEGPAAEMWHRAVPAAMTASEVAFLAAQLPAGVPLLDVPCGDGRLAVPMARAGHAVTGVDQSARLLAWAAEAGAGLPVTWQRRDMRDLPWRQEFGGAFCLGNSFGYLGPAGNLEFLRAVHRTLRPGAVFVLEALVAETVFRNLPPGRWHDFGDLLMCSKAHYEPASSELRVDYLFVRGSERQVCTAWQAVSLASGVVGMLRQAGFSEVRLLGDFTEQPLSLQSQRALFVATA